MKKYFLYRLKKCLVPFLIIAFAGILLCSFPVALSDYRYYRCVYYLAYLSFVLGAACALMPVWLFSYKMEKRSTDLFYSLPVTRTKQLAVHYLTGFITIIAAYTVAFWLSFIFFAVKYSTDIALIQFLWLYLSVIIPAYIIYSISSFAFTRANSVFDGIVFIIFAMLALFAAAVVISSFTSYNITIYNEYITDEGVLENYSYTVTKNYIYSSAFFPFTMLDQVTAIFEGLICKYPLESSSPFTELNSESVSLAVSFGLYTAIAAASTAATFMTERNCKAENCNQVSESIFGYKTMIPLLLLTMCTAFSKYWLDDLETVVLLIIVLAAAYALTAIYKKSFKIGWKTAIALLCAAVIGTVISYVSPWIFK